MLLYNMLLAAWIMLPERTLLQKSLEGCRIRLRLTRTASPAQS
jgi:hypothetical protein